MILCLNFPSVGITGVLYHTQLEINVLMDVAVGFLD
jgi:hypothetical protein